MREKAKILLVDDRPENLLALEAILASLDQELVRAASGEEALKRLLTDEFAVILLDVQMPGLDGYETAQHIKRREKTRDVPIIFLTAAEEEGKHAFRGYAAGAVDYLTKPFDPWVLRAKVAVFVELYAKNRQLREQAELLRRRLAAAGQTDAVGRQPGPGRADNLGELERGDELSDELSSRLAAVEEQLELLLEQGKVTVDPVMAEGVRQLADRVRRLRAALDAMLLPRP